LDIGYNAGSQVLRARGTGTIRTFLEYCFDEFSAQCSIKLKPIDFGYSQIKGDSPELVEYIGMKNLINAVRDGVGLENGKLIFGVGGKLGQGT